MKAAVTVFPGSNCDRDMAVALRQAGFEVTMLWHKETELPPGTDLVAVPGGFSYGDYLRCGAIAAHSPIAPALKAHAGRGGFMLGVCNGFQILTELRLLPGALLQNAAIKFLSKISALRVETVESAFTEGYALGQEVAIPIAHHEGNYTADPETLAALKAEDRIAFRYVDNPNGAAEDIAGILSENRRVLGMMPHPERALEAGNAPGHASGDGSALFAGLARALVSA